eukprot:CAMPEP_0168504848 /NCGR_PEP_ID=MMETSP0228-20121227/76571_1 /TAXON_ID=133427 /ORGANISM="Protoceratium reticulatum, Strain CCCM 535 (=CCMP 1889)" /LENGTH=73 /DNA_ID=CAMNT_0008521925 /DNA_START=53 /DNA_END=271 /DNA_ORIENTATION=-
MCEPLDFLMRGEGVGFSLFHAKHTYQVASCENGVPVPPTSLPTLPPIGTPGPLPPLELPPVPTVAPYWIPPRP